MVRRSDVHDETEEYDTSRQQQSSHAVLQRVVGLGPSHRNCTTASEGTTAAYTLLGGGDLYRLPEPDMLIEDVLPAQSISGLTSYPGVGKTWLAFEMMRALVTGTRFLKRFDTKPGSALFVGRDASVFDYARQWRKLTYLDYLERSQGEEENPYDWTRFLVHAEFTFDNPDHVGSLIETIKNFEYGRPHVFHQVNPETGEVELEETTRQGFSVIIFDTLSKMTRANQNDNSQMEEVFRNIRRIGETTGAAILLLHHNAKRSEFNDGEDWRGAMAQIGALDNWFQLTPSKRDRDLIQFSVKKFRGITPPPFLLKRLVDEENAVLEYHSDEGLDIKGFDDGIEESIVAWLRSDEARGHWFTTQQIARGLFPRMGDLFGGDEEKFRKAVSNRLSNAVKRARPSVAKSGGGGRGRLAKYQATLDNEVPSEVEPQ